MQRPRVSVFLGLSLDGYIAKKNGDVEWMSTYETEPPEDVGYKTFFDSIDALILGRNSYDTVLKFDPWPYAGKQVIVVTTRPAVSQHSETFYNGSISTLIHELAEKGVQHIYLDGGEIVRQGLSQGIVDDITLTWLPIMLGSGIALFNDHLPEIHWKLTACRSFKNGLVQTSYQLLSMNQNLE